MSIPRSQRLIAWHFPSGGGSPSFTSPPEHVTLVKSAYFWNGGTASTLVQLATGSAPDNVSMPVVRLDLAASTANGWQGLVTLNPGDFVFCTAGAADVQVWVSGAILVGENQFPPASREIPQQLPGLRPSPAPLPAQPGMPQPV